MSVSPQSAVHGDPAAIATNRFGLGARADDRASDDPRGDLIAQLGRWEPRPPAIAALPDTDAASAERAAYLADRRRMRQARRQDRTVEPGDAPLCADGQARYRDAVAARAAAAVASNAPFVERLVHFWANHFAISTDKGQLSWLAGPFEFDAIRPRVLGRFTDLLLAVERHPAMLIYLDQSRSIGPTSQAGVRLSARLGRARGLNENLAREILELHTMGVGSGYGQADVTELARALTGRMVAGPGGGERQGDVLFRIQAHEPGDRMVLGQRFADDGAEQADAILRMLATHPATARHVATKLARHFVADTPPPALVDRLTRVFLSTDGDLTAVYRALINAPETWAANDAKFRTPWDWSIAAWRGLGLSGESTAQIAGLLTQLGQPVWRPGSPAGYEDVTPRWAGPDALIRRVEAAERLVARAPDTIDARARFHALYPGGADKATATALARAESPRQALALMLVSPEFLRR